MKIDIRKFLEAAGITDFFYPGKRLVRKCPQPGEYKSHSVVLDWVDPAKIRIDLKPGLMGYPLRRSDLKKYPVSLQSPTYVEIAVEKERADGDGKDGKGEESGSGSRSGKGGGGGRKLKMSRAFADVMEGSFPAFGTVTEMVVMGMKIGAEAVEAVLESFAAQIKAAKVSSTDLLVKAGKAITRYMPPAFLAPKGDETAVYKYDREKNEPMFGGMAPS
ncbi:MAG: hypothetical protein H6862_01710 [Rhodospirillales bacterium]|nr:hypothetical protein [Rhodospirillales bacterium]